MRDAVCRSGLLVLFVACGPGVKRPDPQVAGRDAILSASGDPAAFEQLVRGPVVNGGLWFDDPQCANDFGSPAEVPDAQRAAFARCLAKLGLQRSAREDSLADAIVLEYGAGFEVEARVVPEADGPRLAWIGFESRRDDKDIAPTISNRALEALRASGDPSGPIPPAVAATIELDPTPKSHAAYAWFKVCLDANGAVAAIYAHEMTSVNARNAFRDAIQMWKFRPFSIAGEGMPVCSMVRMTYPLGQGPETEVLPLPPPPSHSKQHEPIVFAEMSKHSLVEGHRIFGEKNVVPDEETMKSMADHHLSIIEGSFRVCIDDAGKVESVLPLRSTGFAAYDRRLISKMQLWVYSPFMIDGESVPVCTGVRFIYAQD
jgi:hypothetical protein